MGHILKDRFLEEDAFTEIYHAAYARLYEQFYGSGQALDALTEAADQVVQAGVDPAALEPAVDIRSATITDRTEALADDPVVTG